ncbi:MAG: Mrp/NBP35 family ATP-binding protein [Anaerolineae bacterium]
MVTKQQVLDALREVVDPEIGQNIVDLGMVREIKIDGADVEVTIALTVPNCPLQDRIADDARGVLDALADDLKVQINLTAMTEAEKQQLTERLRQQRRQPQEEESLAGRMNKVKTVIAVMSGKGGVGKSTAAAMLAAGLRRKGLRVGVLDADITGPSIPKLFGVNDAPTMGPLGIVPPFSKTGIKIMSINLMLEREDQAVIWRGPLIAGAIKQFWNDVFWGDLDVLVVDLPPGTADASLTVMQSLPVDGVVIVTSPQGLADMVVRKAARMAEYMEIPILGIIENMSYAVCPHCGAKYRLFGEGHVEEMAATFDTRVLGRIPLDAELSRRADAGEMEAYENAEFGGVVAQIAEMLA